MKAVAAPSPAESGLVRWVGPLFDLLLVLVAVLALEPLVALAGRDAEPLLVVSIVLGCVAGGLTLSAAQYGARLPSLGGFEGLLLVLTPAAGLILPMVFAAIAPKGAVGAWIWATPIPALFATLLVFGATAERRGAARTLLWARAISAFVWLIATEAVAIAFVRANADGDALGGAIFFMSLCWVPARVISASVDGSRWEVLSALASYGVFVAALLG